MKFRTEIKVPPPPFRLSHRDKILLAGSCFTEHIGAYLREHWFDAMVNPFGTLYNPMSVERLLERSIRREYFTEEELFRHENTLKSFHLPSRFNRSEAGEYLRHANLTLDHIAAFLRQATTVILTYGTAHMWILRDTNRPVVNCHKQPAARFRKHLTAIDELERAMHHTVDMLNRHRPGIRIVFTLSPVRYLQDGFTSNARSKARLLEAMLRTTEAFPENTYYFPAYEIFMDDLRDYRFYAADLKHPGEQGIAYVREIFDATFFDEPVRRLNKEISALRKRLLHRPLAPGATHTKTAPESKSRIEEFLKKHPFLKPDLNF
ncbi:MAG: GSCFA domain-containing protein [Chlorobi bacterium]|nr:GSCFA domain-containing protein [Chlorobiota bacterium]